MKNDQILLLMSRCKVSVIKSASKVVKINAVIRADTWLAKPSMGPFRKVLLHHSPLLQPEVFLLVPQYSMKEHYLLKEEVLSTLLLLEKSDLRAAKAFSWADARFLAAYIYCLLLYFLQVWIRVRKKKQSQEWNKRQSCYKTTVAIGNESSLGTISLEIYWKSYFR